ncbi:hypothetical protein [Pseudomonas putida]|uniref:hypothetical protein n=1 Tax=Pseudomonas putida TaxID=303 RepID=UPI000578E8C8|nr:hypothetical protein [Pseudomonas putida]
MPANELGAHIEGMNKDMRDWTDQAARGECGWICSDCCCSDPKGMPDACFHGHAACTAIIQRDKQSSMREGNEPS